MKENNFFGKVSSWFKKVNRHCVEDMATRNGIDALNVLLFVLYVVLIFLDSYFRTYWIAGCALVLLVLILFRTFSKNLEKRQKENAWLTKLDARIKRRQHFFKQKRRDRKTHVYKKCPGCKKMLRIKRKKGTRTVNCPHCNREIKVHCFYDAK